MKEIWKVYNAPAYGKYDARKFLVSNKGRVKDFSSNTLLSQQGHGNKYHRIKGTWQVHVMVAEAFICPRPIWLELNGDELIEVKAEVNHKDLDKGNNRYKNLEWVTHGKNIRHAVKNGVDFSAAIPLRGELHPCSKLTDKQRKKIKHLHRKYVANNFDSRSGNRKWTLQKLADKFKVSNELIQNIVYKHGK